MIEKITHLKPEEAQKLLNDFMGVYLDKGFGVMNKTEIETLMYHVFRQHKLLSGVCFDDSLALRIPEAKARKLIMQLVPNFKNEDVLKNLSDLQLDDSVKEKGTREFLKELFIMQILI